MNNITKTIQESLNTYLDVFGQRINRDETITDVERLFSETQSHLLQSQIKVIKAVIENLRKAKNHEPHIGISHLHEAEMALAHNSALEDQISSLNETLEFLKKSL